MAKDIEQNDGSQGAISGRMAMSCGALVALSAAWIMLRGVLSRHFDDGVAWSDFGNLMKVDWDVLKGWRPQWWQGWLWWGALLLGGANAIRIGRRIRAAEQRSAAVCTQPPNGHTDAP